MKKGLTISLVTGAIVLAAGGGFWGGVSYEKGKLPGGGRLDFANGAARAEFGNMSGDSATRTRATGGPGGASGEITAKTDNSLTIKLSSGSTETVYYSSSTKVYKDAAATSSDLAVGSKVSVSGTPNSDGSVTAETVRLSTE